MRGVAAAAPLAMRCHCTTAHYEYMVQALVVIMTGGSDILSSFANESSADLC